MVIQGVIEAQIVQFQYGILEKSLGVECKMPFYYNPPNPFWTMCFSCWKRIEMNMVEEWVVTFEFNKEKPKEFSNTVKSTIMRLVHQGCTTKGQEGQTKFKWWFRILFNGTRWKKQVLEVWWASQEGLSQSTTCHNFQP